MHKYLLAACLLLTITARAQGGSAAKSVGGNFEAAEAEAAEAEAAPGEAATVASEVQQALGKSRGLAGSGIAVDATAELGHLTVTLAGFARSVAQKALAGSIAKQKAPGFLIINHLAVLARFAAPAAAVVLCPRIKSALSNSRALNGSRIDVDVSAGGASGPLVELSGTVHTQMQKLLAQAIARREASGVRVVNRLRVTSASNYSSQNWGAKH